MDDTQTASPLIAVEKARYGLIVSRGAGDAAAILAILTPAQPDTLQRQWDKDNRKFIREYRLEETPRDYVEDFHRLTDCQGVAGTSPPPSEALP